MGELRLLNNLEMLRELSLIHKQVDYLQRTNALDSKRLEFKKPSVIESKEDLKTVVEEFRLKVAKEKK